MRILLVTPPMVQVNAPYPATACLAGILTNAGHDAIQEDASLALALSLFSRAGILNIRKHLSPSKSSASVAFFRRHARRYADTVEDVIHFLQGKTPAIGPRIRSRHMLPEGPRFNALSGAFSPTHPFHSLSRHDQAVHLASLYLDDLTDTIREGIDSRFELARYGEKLAASAPDFETLSRALRRKATLIDRMMESIARQLVSRHRPDMVGFTLPFPGNVYGALRMAKAMKHQSAGLPIVMGGGYVNTELRNLADPRVFDYADFITLDDGEEPLLAIISHLEANRPAQPVLRRTFVRIHNRVRYVDRPAPPGGKPQTARRPRFTGLPNKGYFPMIESLNPMHRIWSCERWNKIMLAHGCYWHRCVFCDTRLDYIQRYAATPVEAIIRQIRDVIRQTGSRNFHFVDEAMPPALLRQLSRELIRLKLSITWWGNVRFDAAFTPELTNLMARAGCLAVTGGLEAPTNRLLALLDKGFTLEQATRVIAAFSGSGILTHAYLMYGCPSQTVQDTVDSLEYVRQMFEAGLLQSAYWHRFALTIHSRVFKTPSRYGLTVLRRPKPTFACNEVPFRDSVACDHEVLGRGLRNALFNYMQSAGLDRELQAWFDIEIPPPRVPTDYVASRVPTASEHGL